MDPVDPGAPLLDGHRAGAAHQEHGRAIAPRVEDRHAGVLEPDDVVEDGRHRFARGLRVAVRQRHGHLFMAALQQLRPRVAAVVDDGIVDAPEGRSRVERGVLDAERPKDVDDQIGSVLWTPPPRDAPAAHASLLRPSPAGPTPGAVRA